MAFWSPLMLPVFCGAPCRHFLSDKFMTVPFSRIVVIRRFCTHSFVRTAINISVYFSIICHRGISSSLSIGESMMAWREHVPDAVRKRHMQLLYFDPSLPSSPNDDELDNIYYLYFRFWNRMLNGDPGWPPDRVKDSRSFFVVPVVPRHFPLLTIN